MSIYHSRWSEAETLLGRQLLAEGAPAQQFLDQIGRSRKAAMAHIRSLDYPRRSSLDAARMERSGKRSIPNARGMFIPETVWDDAAKRMAADRSISAYVFGDPPYGYSALDKRESRA